MSIKFFIGLPQPLFVYFRSFQTQILQKKTTAFSGIWTRIVGIEGEQAHHLTTTTAQLFKYLPIIKIITSMDRHLCQPTYGMLDILCILLMQQFTQIASPA